ncbi:MAG: potassium transporter TrkG [Myxococcota bacterium]
MTRYRDFRGVARPVGVVVMGLGVALGLCGLAGWGFDMVLPPLGTQVMRGEWALGLSAGAAFALGAGLIVFGRRHASGDLTRREAILAVALIWSASSAIGALPFVLGAQMSVVDALFESVSGLTTTGATVIGDIEGRLNRPLLLWRSLLQWLGGMGIVVLFVAVFPNIGAGGKFMFGEEVPGTTAEGLRPRIAETSRILWQFYLAFTVVEFLVLFLLGMSTFEALCHALTTMSTGGFSTRDDSIGAFADPWIEVVIASFMLIASVNYGLFHASIRGRTLRVFLRSAEFRTYVVVVVVSTLLLAFIILGQNEGDLLRSLRIALFTVATFISSTGYGTEDYMAYPQMGLWLILSLMFLGGCAGSTAGGIKVERVVLMLKLVWAELRRSFRPALVHVVRMGRTVVPQSALTDVAVFLVVYMGGLALLTGTVATLEGHPLPAAFGASLSCLSNMGPAPFHLGADNFVAYGVASKLLFMLGMLLGRLEFFALLALVVPDFWRR